MVTVQVQTACGTDPAQAVFTISVTAPAGSPGISSVVGNAIDTTQLFKQAPTGCPADLHFTSGPVPNASLPMFLTVTECQGDVDNPTMVTSSLGPFGSECLGLVACGPPGQNQNNPTCISLIKTITALRSTILTQCGDAAALKSKRDQVLTAAAAMQAASIAIAAVAVAMIASLFPWVIIAGIALLVTAGAFSLLAVSLTVWGVALLVQYDQLQGQMDQERGTLAAIIVNLPDVCCTEFIPQGFMDVPVCPV